MQQWELRDEIGALRVRHVLEDEGTNREFDRMFLDLAIELMIERKYNMIEDEVSDHQKANGDEVP